MNLNKEASNKKTLILGLIDPKSLSQALPKAFHVLGAHEREYSSGEICHGKKLSYRGELVEAARILQDYIKRRYYAVLWTNTQVAVIFKDAVFIEHRPLKTNEIESLSLYGKRFGLDPEYFKGIQKDIKNFYKEEHKNPIKKLASSYIINQAGKE
jgi:hypothetical protein